MTLLQAIPDNIQNSFIEEWGAYGGILLLLLIGIAFLVIYIKKENKAEKLRIIKNSEENQAKVEVLYTELKEVQKLSSEKQVDLLLKNQEIHIKTIEALNNSTEALNNNSKVISKIIDKI